MPNARQHSHRGDVESAERKFLCVLGVSAVSPSCLVPACPDWVLNRLNGRPDNLKVGGIDADTMDDAGSFFYVRSFGEERFRGVFNGSKASRSCPDR